MEEPTLGALDADDASNGLLDAVERGRWRVLSTLLRAVAPPLALTGQFHTLQRWTSRVPEDQLNRDPDLLFWSALSILLERPADARPRFIRSFELHDQAGNTQGAWTALGGIIDATFFIYRDLTETDSWIDWITDEREAVLDRMLKVQRAPVVFSIYFLLIFRRPDHPCLDHWRTRAMKLIEEDPASDISGRLTLALVTECTWRGNLVEADIAHKRFHACHDGRKLSPLLSALTQVLDATHYLHTGNVAACREAATMGIAVAASTGVHLWDSILHGHGIAAACSQGDLLAARHHLESIEANAKTGVPIDEAYYRGMRMWLNFTAGQRIGAVDACNAALASADTKGVPYLSATGRLGAALVLFDANHRDRAWQLLREADDTAAAMDNHLLAWIAGLFRAHMLYAIGDTAAADTALSAAMHLGASHGLLHFFMWPRDIITQLVDRCFLRNDHIEYASLLAKHHGLSPPATGSVSDRWPFHARLRTFGPPQVIAADDSTTPLASNTPRQAQLLAAMIQRAGQPVPLQVLVDDIYEDEETSPLDGINALKQLINSLRHHFGDGLVRNQNALSFDFQTVWVDACALHSQVARHRPAAEIERWLRQYYHGHFMEGVRATPLITATRTRLRTQAARAIQSCLKDAIRTGDTATNDDLHDRWSHLFPEVFER